jgi:hypothetical protein
MKYKMEQWLRRTASIVGTDEFAIRDLPEELFISGEINQLVKEGVLQKQGYKYIPESGKQHGHWKINPAYVTRAMSGGRIRK